MKSKREKDISLKSLTAAEETQETSSDDTLWIKLQKKSTSLVVYDTCLNILQTMQVFALLTTMALYWPWPDAWLTYTRFLFFLNLDIWDFMKLHKQGVYLWVQNRHVPSASMPLSYTSLLIGWLVVVVVLVAVYIVVYIVLKLRRSPYLLYQHARLQRVYIVLLQVLFIPFGAVVARVFHCDDNGKVDIDNDLTCYSGTHWVYVLSVGAASVLYLVGYPAWMIFKIRAEMLNMTFDKHEAYLQLKEAEYSLGLDSSWFLDHFFLFSSYKKYGVYYRPAWLLVLAATCILVATLHEQPFTQALIITLLLAVWLVLICIVRPYRVTVFTLYVIACIMCLMVDSMLGTLRSSFTSESVNVWLTPEYLTVSLGMVQGLWLIATIGFILYLIIRPRCTHTRLWPRLSEATTYKISPETSKFIDTSLKTRVFLAHVARCPPLFAPAHEIARQIHVVNAYCREAEILDDPMLETLWDVLELLMNAHTTLAPKSLYAESVKPSIKATLEELHVLMPSFVQRLAQREYDMLMTSPVKRRLLLKMFCMAMLLQNGRNKTKTQEVVSGKLKKVWQSEKISAVDDYFEDMYPEPERGPAEEDELIDDPLHLELQVPDDDEHVVEENVVDTGLPPGLVGVMPPIFTNLVFQDDESDTISFMSERGGFTGTGLNNAAFEGGRLSLKSPQGSQVWMKSPHASQISVRSPHGSQISVRSPHGSQISVRSPHGSQISVKPRDEATISEEARPQIFESETDVKTDLGPDQNLPEVMDLEGTDGQENGGTDGQPNGLKDLAIDQPQSSEVKTGGGHEDEESKVEGQGGYLDNGSESTA